jgi:hypothetical protein
LLEGVEARTRAERATPEDRARGRATLQAAATLLGDAARRSLYRSDRLGARGELRAAERLARAARSPESLEFARRFTLFEGLLLHGVGDLSGAFEVLSEGRRSLEDDAELLLALGAVSESVSALRVYEVPDAQALLAKALKRDPALPPEVRPRRGEPPDAGADRQAERAVSRGDRATQRPVRLVRSRRSRAPRQKGPKIVSSRRPAGRRPGPRPQRMGRILALRNQNTLPWSWIARRPVFARP